MSGGLAGKAITGVAWTGGGRVLKNLIDFSVFTLLARLLTPEIFGLVAYAAAVILFLQMFVEQGMSAALVQKKEMTELDCDSAFWINIAFGIALALSIFLLAVPLSGLLDEPDIAPILKALSLAFFFPALSEVQKARLTREMDFKSLTLREIVASVAGGIAGVTAALCGLGVWALVLRQLVAGIGGTALLWFATSWRPHLRFSWGCVWLLFKFSSSITANRFVTSLGSHGDVFFVGYIAGTTATGIYSIAMRLMLIIQSLMTQTIGIVALPIFSVMQEDKARIEKALLDANGIIALIFFPVFAGMAISAEYLVPLLFGEKWIEVIPVFKVLALIGFPATINFLSMQVLIGIGKPNVVLVLNFMSVAIKLVLLCLATYYGGLWYGVLAVTLFTIVFMPVRQLVFSRKSGIGLFQLFKPFLPSFIAVVVMVAAVYFVKPYAFGSMWLDLLTQVTVGVTAYLLVTYFLNRTYAVSLVERIKKLISPSISIP